MHGTLDRGPTRLGIVRSILFRLAHPGCAAFRMPVAAPCIRYARRWRVSEAIEIMEQTTNCRSSSEVSRNLNGAEHLAIPNSASFYRNDYCYVSFWIDISFDKPPSPL